MREIKLVDGGLISREQKTMQQIKIIITQGYTDLIINLHVIIHCARDL